MELEKAIKYLKLMKMDKNNLNKIGYVYGTEAIKTVLQELKNRIPKKKIEDKIEELEQQREKATEENQIGTGILLTGGINYLEEILEDK